MTHDFMPNIKSTHYLHHRYHKLFVLVDVRKNDTTIVNQHRFYDPLHEQLKEVTL